MSNFVAKIVSFCSSEAPKYVLLRCSVIIFAGFMVYCNTFNMSFNFDDAANIIDNTVVREFSPTDKSWHSMRAASAAPGGR